MYSLKQYIAAHSASHQTYTEFAANHNEVFPEVLMLSLDQLKRKIAEWSGVEPIVHDMCPNTCIAYTGFFEDHESCPVCERSHYDAFKLNRTHGKVKKPLQHFYTMPIGPQIQALWWSPESATQMRYHAQCTEEILEEIRKKDGVISSYEDILHGEEYLVACQSNHITSHSTVFMISMDEAQLYHDKESDCWFFIFVLMEMHPNHRYKKNHVIPAAVVPGLSKPANMDLFFFPTFHHISTLQKEGLKIWNSLNDSMFVSELFFFMCMADGLGSVHFTKLVGHHGAFPCCLFCGLKGWCIQGKSHYYAVLLCPLDYDGTGSNHLDVLVEAIQGSLQADYAEKLYFRSNTRQQITGPLLYLAALCDLLVPLWHGQFHCTATDSVETWPWAVNTGYKAKEWQGHLYGLAPALLYGILPDNIWENFCLLVHAIQILHQHSIPYEFHIGFERLYVKHRADRIHFVPCLGPPILHSAWTIERTIGNLGGEIKQPSSPYANLSERGLKPIVKNVKKSLYSSIDLGDSYKLLTSHGGHIGEAIQIAWCAWKEHTQASHNLRMACKVKFRYKGWIEYGEVMFYFCLELEGSRHGLALMSMYSRLDERLLQDSHWTVYSVAQLPEEIGLRVINATSILAVVLMQPHNHHLEEGDEHFFVWEQIGLEMSILSSCTEVNEL
ncbi:hypothetical protein K439DRAFT_1650261 [Ramaria rubella]|nr:hypothetical protein K439DRAFT_1650261 [Ramaria rubella]